uniref:CBF domain-containing protein n=1 Tax=Trichuris muris TaxID=70415 RepID=A0A5S6R2G3_TRIMR
MVKRIKATENIVKEVEECITGLGLSKKSQGDQPTNGNGVSDRTWNFKSSKSAVKQSSKRDASAADESKTSGRSKWFENELCSLVGSSEKDDHSVAEFETKADQLLQNKCSVFQADMKNANSTRTTWLGEVALSGTLSDRMAALGALIVRNPLCNLKALDSLLHRTSKKNRREALIAAETAKELFLQELLPDRKLIPFKYRPLEQFDIGGNLSKLASRKLLLWKFESELKSRYATYVRNLQNISFDTLADIRIKACRLMADLLIAKAEQEQVLLAALINKVGDIEARVATKVVSYLEQVANAHPAMKGVLISETEKLIYRQNISSRAQFYALCFLIRLPMSRSDEHLAAKLLNIYFELFKIVLQNQDAVEEKRITRQILIGINRVLPLAKGKINEVMQEVDKLYKMAATSTLHISMQTLALICQLLDLSQDMDDRFYRSLYRRMLDPALRSSSRVHGLFFHLLYKALCRDTQSGRTRAISKRLLQTCLTAPTSFVCAALLILSKVQQRKRDLPAKGCHWEYDGDEEEPSHLGEQQAQETDEGVKSKSKNYDPSARNPLYAHADMEPLVELMLLKNHYHPTVALFARCLLEGQPIDYSGDPLEDFSTSRFLERFVFKNPKRMTTGLPNKGDQSMQKGRRKVYDPWTVRSIPVNSKQYASRDENAIPPEERYLHTFVKMEGVKKEEGTKGSGKRPAAFNSVNSGKRTSADSLETGSSVLKQSIDFSREVKSLKRKRRNKSSSEESDEGSNCSSEGEDTWEPTRKSRKPNRGGYGECQAFNTAEEFAELLEEAEVEERHKKGGKKRAKLRKRKANRR